MTSDGESPSELREAVVVAEGRRRLVKTIGQYTAAEAPKSEEITASRLFLEPHATPLSVVRQLRADLPHDAPRDVADGLAALEQLLTG